MQCISNNPCLRNYFWRLNTCAILTETSLGKYVCKCVHKSISGKYLIKFSFHEDINVFLLMCCELPFA